MKLAFWTCKRACEKIIILVQFCSTASSGCVGTTTVSEPAATL